MFTGARYTLPVFTSRVDKPCSQVVLDQRANTGVQNDTPVEHPCSRRMNEGSVYRAYNSQVKTHLSAHVGRQCYHCKIVDDNHGPDVERLSTGHETRSNENEDQVGGDNQQRRLRSSQPKPVGVAGICNHNRNFTARRYSLRNKKVPLYIAILACEILMSEKRQNQPETYITIHHSYSIVPYPINCTRPIYIGDTDSDVISLRLYHININYFPPLGKL